MYVYRTLPASVSPVGLYVVHYFLPLGKCFSVPALDLRKMNKNILTSIIVRNKANPFFLVKPFDSTAIHK